MTDEIDVKLAGLLRVPERAPDEAFVARVRQAVAVEQRLSVARRAAWRRFAGEMAGVAAALAAWWLLARITPADSEGFIPLASPAAAGLLMLALLVLVSYRPGGRAGAAA